MRLIVSWSRTYTRLAMANEFDSRHQGAKHELRLVHAHHVWYKELVSSSGKAQVNTNLRSDEATPEMPERGNPGNEGADTGQSLDRRHATKGRRNRIPCQKQTEHVPLDLLNERWNIKAP